MNGIEEMHADKFCGAVWQHFGDANPEVLLQKLQGRRGTIHGRPGLNFRSILSGTASI
jgi:hypothetical protein